MTENKETVERLATLVNEGQAGNPQPPVTPSQDDSGNKSEDKGSDDSQDSNDSKEFKEIVSSDNQMTEDEIDLAVESGDLTKEKAEELKAQYGYDTGENKTRNADMTKKVKGDGDKGNLYNALRNVRDEKSNLQNQIFHGQNNVKAAQNILKSLEEEFADEALTGSAQKKLNEANEELNKARQNLLLSEKKMHQLQVKEILIDEENYPAAKEIWDLAQIRIAQNPAERDELEKSDNIGATAYAIGQRHPKAQETINKFRDKIKLKDKVARNLEALKQRSKSPGTPAGTGGGHNVSQIPKFKELKEKIRTKTTEEDVLEALNMIEGKHKKK